MSRELGIQLKAGSEPAVKSGPIRSAAVDRNGAYGGSHSPAHDTPTPATIAPPLTHEFSRIRVSPAVPGVLQGRLVIGQPGDRFEKEADAVANLVMERPATAGRVSELPAVSRGGESLRRAPAEPAGDAPAQEPGQTADASGVAAGGEKEEGTAEQVAAILLESDDLESGLGLKPAAAEPAPAEAGGEGTVQARELPGQVPTVPSTQSARIDALRGGGQPLSESSRAFFEPRFGQDLGHVRVHTGTGAGRLARAVRAEAFTVGRDIVFGEGNYRPASAGGRWLMAHELTHVLQQQEGLSRSTAEKVHLQNTGQVRLQRGFWGDVWGGMKSAAGAVWGGIKSAAGAVWGGIKKAAGAVWGGIKKAASAVWRGAKWLAGKAWGAMKKVGRWGWNVLKSGAALAWSLVVATPARIWRLLKHLGSGVAGVASWMWEGLKLAWHLDFKRMGDWLLDGLRSGAAWTLRLLGKLVDVAGVDEVWDLLSQIIKVNTRSLTDGETKQAKRTFRDSISYWKVRVDEHSLISTIGAAAKGATGMGVTTFHTVNFNKTIKADPGTDDMHWLTHELTHVSQAEHVGSQYLGEAIHAQSTAGYDYKGQNSPLWRPDKSTSPNPAGKHFREYNREQQASIAADYYFSLFGKMTTSDTSSFFPVTDEYEPVINELRAGNM